MKQARDFNDWLAIFFMLLALSTTVALCTAILLMFIPV